MQNLAAGLLYFNDVCTSMRIRELPSALAAVHKVKWLSANLDLPLQSPTAHLVEPLSQGPLPCVGEKRRIYAFEGVQAV